MMNSMTAFARSQKQVNGSLFCWEIRSVNHRYLDVSFRLPDSFRFLETSLRASLRDKIHRGRLECQLKYQDTNADNQSMIINKGMINALIGLSEELADSYQLANDVNVSQLLTWPGVVQFNQQDTEELAQFVMALYDETIEKLIQARSEEGNALKRHIDGRLQGIKQVLGVCESLVSTLANQTKDKLHTRLKLLNLEIPEERFEQEIALILTRLDVSEELDRIQTHIVEVDRVLNCDKVAGRRLDFLMQELNREANTLSSKSDSADLTRSAVEMKVLIEQMREQIQNIE